MPATKTRWNSEMLYRAVGKKQKQKTEQLPTSAGDHNQCRNTTEATTTKQQTIFSWKCRIVATRHSCRPEKLLIETKIVAQKYWSKRIVQEKVANKIKIGNFHRKTKSNFRKVWKSLKYIQVRLSVIKRMTSNQSFSIIEIGNI